MSSNFCMCVQQICDYADTVQLYTSMYATCASSMQLKKKCGKCFKFKFTGNNNNNKEFCGSKYASLWHYCMALNTTKYVFYGFVLHRVNDVNGVIQIANIILIGTAGTRMLSHINKLSHIKVKCLTYFLLIYQRSEKIR